MLVTITDGDAKPILPLAIESNELAHHLNG